jgi:gas vesicle protein
MSDNRSDALVAFLVGAAIGAGVALLLAPASGEETRKKLGEGAKKLGDELDDRVRTAREDLKGRAGELKTAAINAGRDAIGAGREAVARMRHGEEPAPTSTTM